MHSSLRRQSLSPDTGAFYRTEDGSGGADGRIRLLETTLEHPYKKTLLLFHIVRWQGRGVVLRRTIHGSYRETGWEIFPTAFPTPAEMLHPPKGARGRSSIIFFPDSFATEYRVSLRQRRGEGMGRCSDEGGSSAVRSVGSARTWST